MTDRTKKDVRFLKFYSGFLTIALIITILYMGPFSKNKSFEEIDVERINVVENNGDLKLVISNSERQHPGIINGKPLPERQRKAGLIFFNSAGDECGGLIYDGNDRGAGLVLSVDKYRDDQVMQLRYIENTAKDKRTYGLQLWDYQKEDGFDERTEAFERLNEIENKEKRTAAYNKMKDDGLLPANRMFVGKRMNKDVGLFINDNKGKPRIKIYIDENNEAKFELLNEEGENIL